MLQSHEFRRHRDGAIDVDFYRMRATALRRRAMRDRATRKKRALRSVLVIVAVLSVATAGVAATARMRGGLMTVAPSGVPQVR
jgi:hypothetical protein